MTATTRDWAATIADIRAQYPSVARRDWVAVTGSTETMGAIIRDVLSVGHSPVRRGHRPVPDFEDGTRRLREMQGEDITTLPFREAFVLLAGRRSRSHVASLTGIKRTRVHRLLTGIRGGGQLAEVEPTGAEMEAIAGAFGRRPLYFREYRAAVIAALVHETMLNNPEASAGIARRLGIGAA